MNGSAEERNRLHIIVFIGNQPALIKPPQPHSSVAKLSFLNKEWKADDRAFREGKIHGAMIAPTDVGNPSATRPHTFTAFAMVGPLTTWI